MDCIVLVKQVPDVSNIPEEAWDREKGTLRRAMLDSILNPLDLHALTFADRLTRGDPEARTVFLSMGPPQAREVLVDCLSRVPGRGDPPDRQRLRRRRHRRHRLLPRLRHPADREGALRRRAATT